MKALTLTQPWATAIVKGYKTVETRSWRTNYRGDLYIHAAKGYPKEAQAFAAEERAIGRLVATPLPLGALICIVTLRDCVPTEEAAITISENDPAGWGLEHRYGDYSPGRWAWMLENVRVLAEPIFVRGALGLWEFASDDA